MLFRPSKSGKAYERVWDKKRGSPLRFITEKQVYELKKQLKSYDNIVVDYAMRYGKPSIKEMLNNLFDYGCTRILIMPLYPCCKYYCDCSR